MATSARFALPLLEAGQAQKEMFHNEALALIDLAIGAYVEAVGRNDPPELPVIGQSWIVGSAPSGAWSGRADALAGWTAAGWRFLLPVEGLGVWDRATGTRVTRLSHIWQAEAKAPPIATPEGGTVVDVEARSAIAAVLAEMRARGWIQP